MYILMCMDRTIYRKEDGFMFFPNHQGLYDVLAIVDACPDHPFSVVAKQEVKNIQFFKAGICLHESVYNRPR